MAKKEKGKSRLRVFFADFEGDDETIQESLRAISNAVSKTFQPKVVALPPSAAGNVENLEELIVESELDSDEDELAVAGSSNRQRKRKPPTMSVVKNLDLRPSDKQSLRDFFESKSPTSQEKSIAVFVYYLDKILEIDGITPNHVYSCFKDVSARSPKDLPQIIRNVASRGGWVDNTDPNKLKITNPGENYVEHDLPEKPKQ